MPGTMFIQPATLDALPTVGTAWDRLNTQSVTDPGVPNLSLTDTSHQLNIFSIALRWAKDGGGLGRDAVINGITAAMGTEVAIPDWWPYRTLAPYILAADLVDMPGDTIGANGMTFTAWVQAWPGLLRPSFTAIYNTLYKAARTAPHYYGCPARASALACALWMLKEGVEPTGTGVPATAAALRDEIIGYFKRWCGDTSIPNTFNTPVNYVAAWAIGTFPTTQGVVNPVDADITRSGADVADASSSGAPPLTGGAGKKYTYESLDGVDLTVIMLIAAGYTDAAGYGNDAVRRVYRFLIDNNLTSTGGQFTEYHFSQVWFANYMWDVNFPIQTTTGVLQNRLLTAHTDWLTSPGSTWLRTSGGGEPVIVAPTVSFTAVVDAQTVLVDASASTTGSAAILRHDITWGDGTTTSLPEPTRTGSHVYSPSVGGQTYTITVTAVAADTGEASSQRTVLVTSPEGTPVAMFALSKPTVTGTDPVDYSFAGSFSPQNAALTYAIDWGDGTVVTDAPQTGSHTYEDPEEAISYTVVATASDGTFTSSPVAHSLTVVTAASGRAYAQLYVGSDSGPLPVLPVFESTWNGMHLMLGTFHIWADGTGILRAKQGAPTSATDGVPVGSGGGAGLVVVAAGSPPPVGTPAGTVVFEV